MNCPCLSPAMRAAIPCQKEFSALQAVLTLPYSNEWTGCMANYQAQTHQAFKVTLKTLTSTFPPMLQLAKDETPLPHLHQM